MVCVHMHVYLSTYLSGNREWPCRAGVSEWKAIWKPAPMKAHARYSDIPTWYVVNSCTLYAIWI